MKKIIILLIGAVAFPTPVIAKPVHFVCDVEKGVNHVFFDEDKGTVNYIAANEMTVDNIPATFTQDTISFRVRLSSSPGDVTIADYRINRETGTANVMGAIYINNRLVGSGPTVVPCRLEEK